MGECIVVVFNRGPIKYYVQMFSWLIGPVIENKHTHKVHICHILKVKTKFEQW